MTTEEEKDSERKLLRELQNRHWELLVSQIKRLELRHWQKLRQELEMGRKLQRWMLQLVLMEVVLMELVLPVKLLL